MKIVKIDEYNIMIILDREESLAMRYGKSAEEAASALLHVAVALTGKRCVRLTLFPSKGGDAVFIRVKGEEDLADGYIYGFSEFENFLAACRDAAPRDAFAMTDGAAFYISSPTECPGMCEFGATSLDRHASRAVFETCRPISFDMERLGALAQ